MISITLTHEQVMALVSRLGEPDDSYQSAAGPTYGLVRAWRLGRSWLLAVSAGGRTDYAIADRSRDLADILEDAGDPDDTLDRLVRRANTRGIQSVDEATGDEPGPYYVLETRHYYGPMDETRVIVDDAGLPLECASYEDAVRLASARYAEGYSLAPGECARSHYRIVAV